MFVEEFAGEFVKGIVSIVLKKLLPIILGALVVSIGMQSLVIYIIARQWAKKAGYGYSLLASVLSAGGFFIGAYLESQFFAFLLPFLIGAIVIKRSYALSWPKSFLISMAGWIAAIAVCAILILLFAGFA